MTERDTIETLTARELVEKLSAAIRDAFVAYTIQTQQAREDLYALTMSGLGGCTRQAAYRLARTPPSEEKTSREMREANIGTMMHAGLLPHLAELLGGEEEIAVELTVGDLIIKGRSDLYTPALKLVGDLKTFGTYRFASLGNAPGRAHRLQIAGYALAAIQAGREVEWIAWLNLDRSSGADHVVVEPWTDELAMLVEQRCADLATYAVDPEAAPRDERGPGLSVICDGCPWLRTCWGKTAEPGAIGAQRILAHDNAGVARALALYDEARSRERQAAADKEFAKAMFGDYEPGAYGEFVLDWSSVGETDDKDAAVALLKQAGIPIPRKPGSRRLIVRRTK